MQVVFILKVVFISEVVFIFEVVMFVRLSSGLGSFSYLRMFSFLRSFYFLRLYSFWVCHNFLGCFQFYTCFHFGGGQGHISKSNVDKNLRTHIQSTPTFHPMCPQLVGYLLPRKWAKDENFLKILSICAYSTGFPLSVYVCVFCKI